MKYYDVEFHTCAGIPAQFPEHELPEIAFAGRSNAGKSTLINKLLNRKGIAKISQQPGKTRTINFYDVDRGLMLVDLPGYGYAKADASERTRWAGLLDGYFSRRDFIKFVVIIVDGRHDAMAKDVEMINYVRHMDLPFVVAVNKIDAVSKTKRDKHFKKLSVNLGIPLGEKMLFTVSARTGEGIDVLREHLFEGIF
jgi:GTP-binding protein